MTLTEWMTREGVTDAELARKIGVSRPFIARIKTGERQPSLPVAVRLAELTKLPASTFIKGVAA